MASASHGGGLFDTPTRQKLLVEAAGIVKKARQRKPGTSKVVKKVAVKSVTSHSAEGCKICKQDNNYTEMLICDKCNAEYHMGCLAPPLKWVPENEWYCRDCRTHGDGLDEMVAALPPAFASLFGVIVWAQGGTGYGWWPSIVYDPRYTLGSTRSEARKYLGKRHLCFFFHCHEVPFAVLTPNKIALWEEGLARDYHFGKGTTAKGGSRRSDFVKALQIANLEGGIPVHKRIASLQEPAAVEGFDQALTSPKKAPPTPVRKQSISRRRSGTIGRTIAKGPSFALKAGDAESNAVAGVVERSSSAMTLDMDPPPKRGRLAANNAAVVSGNQLSTVDHVACQIFVTEKQGEVGTRRGFLFMKPDITFAELRNEINRTQETELLPKKWRFVHGDLGPLSLKLERSMSVMPLLKPMTTPSGAMANGLQVSLIAYANL